MMFRFANFGSASAVIIAALAACSPVDTKTASADVEGLRGFESEAELDRFARRMAKRSEDASEGVSYMVPALPPMDMAAESAAEAVDAAAEPESITNTQEAGVDEGGIVKNAGDYLVVLRRGRVFTIRTGDDTLRPVDAIDAFPPGKQSPGDTWYDELLVRGDQVIVIGYSYGDFGSEVSRFRLSADGQLSYRDTYYLRSGDYYSSSNYASRVIGDELIFYAPLGFAWDEWRNRMPALRKRGEDGEGKPLVAPEDFYVAEPYRNARYQLEMLHVVTRCNIAAAELDCRANAVVGTWGHAFYVSREAVYVWTGTAREQMYDDESPSTPGQLFRLPLDGSRPGAVAVIGSPIDQFSFSEDSDEGLLRVVLRESGDGDGMWSGEYSQGDVALISVPFGEFGDGSGELAKAKYRKLSKVDGWQFQNRFVGDWLLYAASEYGSETREPYLYAVPLDGRDAQKVSLKHGITRFDVLGADGLAVGPGRNGTLGFSAISLGQNASVEDTYILASAGEGETRSQAFFYRSDAGSNDGVSGTLGLPVTRSLTRTGAEFLGSGSSIFFLRRNDREFSPAGELVARTDRAINDNCAASCVDWYGNARPIFLGDRIFALMGYELVEGRLENGRIQEVRRVDYTPQARAGG